ncbi:zinc finger CCCH domain-containing protein 3 [Salvia miltiorrhiza]|uniref:zinc finger CCCH domain-containing protein 3 n=1 Tax=Salvia miltiorrhiza TaxID=226208 RepID=UPI0025ACE03C|nr:zinc finger CCCH domain-containing protein 3 [Salvia miltiorrhiza]
MPLGKYYCDYCDKQFQDTPPSRRRHLNGVAHQRAKALWYDALRSSSQLAPDQVDDFQSVGKGVCHRFVRTGSCQYGHSCKYYHPKKNLPNMNAQRMEGTTAQSGGIPGSRLNGGATLPALLFGNQMGMSLGNLPPSLLPPPEGGYPPLPFVDWG